MTQTNEALTATQPTTKPGEPVAAHPDGILLDPVAVGPYLLKNRIVLPPLTRSRAGDGDTPTELHAVYYAQRADASLLVTEGSPISQQGTGFPWTPGSYTDAQVEGWRRVTEAVHRRGSRIFLQLWHVGRQSHSSLQEGGAMPVSPSAVAPSGKIFTAAGLQDFETPRALETDEIPGIVDDFVAAAKCALAAGFDGVEVHGANGYLIDSFLCESANQRTDEYGGSVENRLRFPLEVVEAVIGVWGADRVGVRLSPSSTYGDMFSSDKREVYTELVTRLNGYGLAYLHLIEPAISGSENVEAASDAIPTSHFRAIFDGPLIAAGGLSFDSAEQLVTDGVADLVAFGKASIANPDLVEVYTRGGHLREPERAHYYGGGAVGYTDYPGQRDLDTLARLQRQIAAGALTRSQVVDALAQVDAIDRVIAGTEYAYLALTNQAEDAS